VSAHVDGTILQDETGKRDAALESLKKRGFEYVVFPYVAPNLRGGMDVYKRMAASFNKIGEKAKSTGLTFCYHNHAFEFQPMDGTTPLQTLLGDTDKNLVSLELDIFWVSVAGHDPVEMLKAHGDRIRLMHLKNKAAGMAVQYNEKVPKEAFKEVGNGSLDIPAVLKAAAKTDVKHYFVEQDQTPGDPIASLRQSYQYLSNV
jgi:sugar phosphate isomerase/epimerase